MKRFLHKRWHSIPVGIISAVMVVCLVAGGALAAYGFWDATATVNVAEPMTVVYDGDPEWNWAENAKTLTASLDPNSGIAPEWTVKNTGKGLLKIIPSVDNSYAKVRADWLPVEASLMQGESCAFCLTIFADGDVSPGDYTFNLAFTRE